MRWRKFVFAAVSVLGSKSLQIFAHATTAQLSWHVQKFAVIIQSEFGLEEQDFHQIQITMENL